MESLVTLQEMVQAVADACRDLTPGVTSAGSAAANTMQVAALAGRRPNHWQNSEIVFLEPSAALAGQTGANPFVVAGYQDGLFTLDHDFGPAGVPQGIEFFMVRNHGQGNPYRAYLRALKRAVDNLGISNAVTDTSLVTAAGVYTYTIPAGLDTVYLVTINNPDYGPLAFELRPDQWELLPGRTIQFASNLSVDYLWNLTIYGRSFDALPTALDATLSVDIDDVVDSAQEWLNRTSNRPVDQAKGQNLQAERIRFKRRWARPNERIILP